MLEIQELHPHLKRGGKQAYFDLVLSSTVSQTASNTVFPQHKEVPTLRIMGHPIFFLRPQICFMLTHAGGSDYYS